MAIQSKETEAGQKNTAMSDLQPFIAWSGAHRGLILLLRSTTVQDSTQRSETSGQISLVEGRGPKGQGVATWTTQELKCAQLHWEVTDVEGDGFWIWMFLGLPNLGQVRN